jgi:hypothetical protein
MDGITEIITILIKVFKNLVGDVDQDNEERPAEVPIVETAAEQPADQSMPDESVFAGESTPAEEAQPEAEQTAEGTMPDEGVFEGETPSAEEPEVDDERPVEDPQVSSEPAAEASVEPGDDEDALNRPAETPGGGAGEQAGEETGAETAESPAGSAGLPKPVTRKVLAVIYDPLVPSARGHKLSNVMGGHDPEELINGFINDIKEVSAGYADYVVTGKVHANHLPVLTDGFQYSPDGLLLCWQNRGGYHQPDLADYGKIIEEFKMAERVNSGEFDEVWLFGPPYAGFYESRMVGSGAFYLNSTPHRVPKALERRFVIMGFNYERGVGEMLESYGHRVEDTMKQVYRKLPAAANLWDRFTRHERSAPGMAEVGTIHFAPNSERDYDWGNLKPVMSRCENWLKFPDLSADAKLVECSLWGGGDMRAHHRWWFQRLPHVSGKANGIDCNWWKYIIDPNEVK